MGVAGKRVALLVAEGYNDREFWYPYYRLKEEAVAVTVVGPQGGTGYAGKAGIRARAEKGSREVAAADFDGLIIPGGHAPEHFRRDPAMVRLAKEMAESGKVVAAICHGGLLLAAAGVLAGRTVTGLSAIRKELVEAGATFLDQEVVIDGNCITSRRPDDLPAFLRAFLQALAA